MAPDSGFTHRQTMKDAVRFNSLKLHEEAARIAEEIRRRDAERLELEIAGGDLRSGIPALYGNAKHTKPTPTPFTKPKREAKALNEEAAEIIGEEEEE